MTQYKNIKIRDNNEPLILVEEYGFLFEPFYFKQGISPMNEVRLRKGVLEKLRKAEQKLPVGWKFKIYDGYRLLETQKRLFDGLYNYYRNHNPNWDKQTLHDKTEVFVAVARYDKTHPSPHNTGGAVDLTIVDENGKEISMGTVLDEFSERGLAFTDYFADKNDEIHENRMLLKDILRTEGFQNYKYEWWHYSFGDQMWAFQSDADYAIYGSVELNEKS